MTNRKILFAFLAVLSFAPMQTAGAQSSRDYDLCEAVGGDPDQAIAACTRIAASGKHEGAQLATVYMNRGHHLGRKQELDTAIKDFDEALRLNPRNAQAWTNRGAMYGRKKEYDRALADHTRAIELDNVQRDAWYNRGLIYELKGDKQRAISDYRRALEVNPNDDDARKALKELGG